MAVRILVGHVIDQLRSLPDESVHMVVTSPPYWGLRDYGIPPSIWDDDPECEHEWGETIAVNATNHTTKARWNHTRNGRDELQPPEKRVSWLRTEVKQGQFCQRCGAWAGAFGLEPTYQLYINHAVTVFRAVRRVLRKDGTCWLNLGDCYASGGGTYRNNNGNKDSRARHDDRSPARLARAADSLKPKDLVMIPARVAIALQDDGWWVRQDVIWHKPNPMPESTTDRPTTAHEHLFLLAKSARYFYDAEAIKEISVSDHDSGNGFKREARLSYTDANGPRGNDEQWRASKKRKVKVPGGWDTGDGAHGTIHRTGRTEAEYVEVDEITHRNKRSVWTIATSPYPEAHFATFPPDLVEPCILAGTSEYGVCTCGSPWERVADKQFTPQQDVSEERGIRCAEGQKPMDATSGWPGVPRGTTTGKTLGWQPTCSCGPDAGIRQATVLDCFGGAGTTALVADRLKRDAILVELNPSYARMAESRLRADAGLFADIAAD